MHINNTLPIKGKKVLIVGNRSHKNMGDELIVLGTLKLLMKEGKKIAIAAQDPLWLKGFFKQCIDTSKVSFFYDFPKGLRSLFKFLIMGRRKGLSKFWQAESVIIGGGEILTEENPSSYRYRIVSILPCLIKKIFKPVDIYLMGGIQVPKKTINRLLFKFLLKRITHIFARDRETVDELQHYGYQEVEFFMDTSYFAYDWKKVHSPAALIPNQYIVVNLNKKGEHFLHDMVQDIREYLVKGYRILFVPVGKGFSGDYLDIKYYYKLKNKLSEFESLPLSNFTLLDWEYDFHGFVTTLAGAALVISSRLHLFLISEFLGVPTKVYPYQRKILKMQKVIQELKE